MKRLYLCILTLVLLLGCGDNNAKNESVKQPEDTAAVEGGNKQINDDIVRDILQSIPSPLEISMLIKEIGADYRLADLNDHSAVSRYNNNYKKALNLGVYSTDLGYGNIYGKNQDALNYLTAIKNLADGLFIGQFFDYNTVKRFAEQKNKLDSLLITTTQNFDKINFHLRQQKRESLSILILTGGWVEATYLMSLVYERSNNALLKEKIGEQKIVLERLLLVLDVYKNKPDFPGLIADLTELKKIYDRIEIETIYDQPTMVEQNGELIFKDNTKTVVKITDKDIESISGLLKGIRNKIIK